MKYPLGPWVPAAMLVPYLDEYLETGKLIELANSTGVDSRVIYDIRSGRRERVSFNMADRLLTGMGLAIAWHDDEALRRIYALV